VIKENEDKGAETRGLGSLPFYQAKERLELNELGFFAQFSQKSVEITNR
jgi:hypothetical protein